MAHTQATSKTVFQYIVSFIGITIGTFLAAFSIEVFLFPNEVIDGGIVGISMIIGSLYGHKWIPYALIVLNIPFIILAIRSLGKGFVANMILALVLFSAFMHITQNWILFKQEDLDTLEVIVIGGILLGGGLGLVIRHGGCVDGTEILGILINKRLGFTVGQVVLFFNFFIFAAAGFAFQDWHSPLKSLMTFIVAIKIMDIVIVGLEETKSVTIISSRSQDVADAIMHELGLGLTILYGRGGFSGEQREIIYVVTERLQLSQVKSIAVREDPLAFIAIENIHEVTTTLRNYKPKKDNLLKRLTGTTST